MVATSHPLASSAALSILKEGGNAVDAAITAAAVLAVVEPQMTGIGGDCFAMVKSASGELTGINGSGRSAKKTDGQWFRDNQFSDIPFDSVHAITTPGALKTWDALHQNFGSVEFERLFVDAIHYADQGYHVAPRVAFDWQTNARQLCHDKVAAKLFLKNGQAPKCGQKMANLPLGRALKLIAKKGVEVFYQGEIAEDIVSTVAAKGGMLSLNDLAEMECEWFDPVSTNYCGYRVSELPPNGQGIVALIMMNLLTLLESDHLPIDSAERYHLEIEVGRVAYAVRDVTLADVDFMQVSTEELISIEFAQTLLPLIDRNKRNEKITLPHLPNADTVYLAVADKNGMMVSLINSIYTPFGSGIVAPNSGVLLQNRGACFNLIENHPNEIASRKRPMHTIIPAMASQPNRKDIAFGVMGGAYQPMGHLHVLSNFAKYGNNPQQSLDSPRAFWSSDGVIEVEANLPDHIKQGLVQRGHRLRPALSPIGGGQMIIRDYDLGAYIGGSDPRKDGLAIAY